MKIFKKKEVVIPVDENGNPIEVEKKGINWKGLGLKVLAGIGCLAVSTVAVVMIGVAMCDDEKDTSDDSSDSDDTETIPEETGEASES